MRRPRTRLAVDRRGGGACRGRPPVLLRHRRASSVPSAFAKENLASFSTFTLSNGLPVIVKQNSANRVQHISLIIRGGSAAPIPARPASRRSR